jgi:hypothetical protein
VEERQARRVPPPGRPSARDRGRPAPPPPDSPEAQLAAEAAGLFQPAAETRGPQDWLERLRAAAAAPPPTDPAVPAPAVRDTARPTPAAGVKGQARIVPDSMRAVERPSDSPAPSRSVERPRFAPPVPPPSAPAAPAAPGVPPVANAVRRFLTPLLGIDPGEVNVVQGPEADALAAAHDADAITREETIVLGSSVPARTPEGLGLLAHELVHVARHRDPRFVPPVLKAPQKPPQPKPAGPIPPTAARVAPARPSHERPARDPEEAIAERVEATVRRAAADPEIVAGADSPVLSSAAPGAGSRSRWGPLPAPWEPMPEVGDDAEDGDAADDGPLVASVAGAGAESQGAAPAAAPAAGGVQRAARDRRGDEEESAEGSGSGGGQGGPDVDALARQVYGILKRRIAAERRRGA